MLQVCHDIDGSLSTGTELKYFSAVVGFYLLDQVANYDEMITLIPVDNPLICKVSLNQSVCRVGHFSS
jgi:hypothetical protein